MCTLSHIWSQSSRTSLEALTVNKDKIPTVETCFSPEEIARYLRKDLMLLTNTTSIRWACTILSPPHQIRSPFVDLAHGVFTLSSENKKSCSLPQSFILAQILSEHESSGRVLTSSENLLRLEKEKKDAELAEKQRKRKGSKSI